jgi:hypothetical protein
MASESGDTKLLGNFDQLSEIVATHPDYKPANEKIKVPALKTQSATAKNVMVTVSQAEAAFNTAVNERKDLFANVPGLMSRSGNMLKVSDASRGTLDDAQGLRRKITGQRKTAKVKDDPGTPPNEAVKRHSVSQQSFASIAGHVDDYIAIVETVPGYQPNEQELTVAGLKTFSSDLKAKNEAVNVAFAALRAARGRRDELLYLAEDCIVNIGLLVKAYVRAAFGPDSQIFKSIKGIGFKRQKK